jgi:hypothetical protein
MVQRNFIFFAVEKSQLAPTELVHLFCERILPENLLSKIVSPQEKCLGLEGLNAPHPQDPLKTVGHRCTR